MLEKLKKKARELVEKMRAAFEELSTLKGKEERDEDAVATKQTEYDGMKTEYEDLVKQIEDAKALADAQDAAKSLEGLGADDAIGKRLAGVSKADPAAADEDDPFEGSGLTAKAIDHIRDEFRKEEIFFKYLAEGKTSLSGEEREAVAPKSEKLRKSPIARHSIAIPKTIRVAMLGPVLGKQMFPDEWEAYGKRVHDAAKVIYSVANPFGGLNPSAGQNLVPPDYRPELQYLPFDEPTVADLVTVVPAPYGVVTYPRLRQTAANTFGGISWTWIQEGQEKPETEPVFEQIDIYTHEVAGHTEVSDRMLSRSAIDLRAFLTVLFRGSMRFLFSQVAVNGSGVAQPLGIINDPGINVVARTQAGTVVAADLSNLKYAVHRPWRTGARYVLDDTVEQALDGAVDTLGRPLFSTSFANGLVMTLKGYPYIGNVENPAIGNIGDIFFGNLRAYFMAMEEDITIAESEHYRFLNNITVFKVYALIGGRPMFPYAFSRLGAES